MDYVANKKQGSSLLTCTNVLSCPKIFNEKKQNSIFAEENNREWHALILIAVLVKNQISKSGSLWK